MAGTASSRILHRLRAAALVISASGATLGGAQRPVVYPGGVVNAASLVPAVQSGCSIAPRSLISIFGEHLAASTASAPAAASGLPRALAGTRVNMNGTDLPLIFVSPAQVNAQVPTGILEPSSALMTASLFVETPTGKSEAVPVNICETGLAVFTQESRGCGQGAILNLHGDGSASVNSRDDSFDPTSDWGFAAFATGLGSLSFYAAPPPDGMPAPFEPSRNVAPFITAVAGEPGVRQPMTVDYAGPSSQFTGVDQINVFSPETAASGSGWPEGCTVPLFFTDGESTATQIVAMSIREGGGACADPAPERLGQIRWERETLLSQGKQQTSSRVVIQFVEGVRAGFDPLPSPAACVRQRLSPVPSACADIGPRKLDAGILTVAGPGFGPLRVVADAKTGDYRLDLAPEAVTGGTYRVSGNGGADVGPFDTTITIPPPVRITSDPAGPGDGPLRLAWDGGDSGSVLSAELSIHAAPDSGALGSLINTSASAPDGQVDFCACESGLAGAAAADLTVTVEPAAASVQTFGSRGLTLGGQHRWRQRVRFPGLTTPANPACGTHQRTVSATEVASIFTQPNGFGWSDLGAYVGNPGSPNFRQLAPEALKVVHGRFHMFKPIDNTTASRFPYSAFQEFEAREIAAGRPPLFATASYGGSARPLLWRGSLALNGDTPSAPAELWERAVNVQDERFIRFWIDRYVRSILWSNLAGTPNLWVGLDQCGFDWDSFGVLDQGGRFVGGVPWDAWLPQNQTEYLSSIKRFFRRLRELAPDIPVMCNVGSLPDWSQFASVYTDVPGIMEENLNDRNASTYGRSRQSAKLAAFSWYTALGRVAIFRALVDLNDASSLRTACMLYLLVRGPNSFFAPKISNAAGAVDPASYRAMLTELGNPSEGMQSRAEPGLDGGDRLYWRTFEKGIVYVNWTGKTQEVDLPAGVAYTDPNGVPVTRITIPDLTGTYVKRTGSGS